METFQTLLHHLGKILFIIIFLIGFGVSVAFLWREFAKYEIFKNQKDGKRKSHI